MTKFDPATLSDFAQRNEAARLHEIWHAAWNKELDADEDESVSDADAAALTVAAKAAAREAKACCDSAGNSLMVDYEEALIRCAACGVPLWEDDEVLLDTEANEVFLRAALGLPPRAVRQVLPDQEVLAATLIMWG